MTCQSSDLGTLQHYCTMLCGYFHSGPETRAHLSDCVNEQYRGLRAIYVCNRHGWLRAVSEYNSGSVCGSLSWTSTEHRLRTAGFRLLYFFKFQKCCFYVYCSALTNTIAERLRRSFESVIFTGDVRYVGTKPCHVTFLISNGHLFVLLNFNC